MPALLDPDVVERQREAISQARGRIYQESYANHVEPFADVAALFRRARHDGWTIVLATSSPSEEVEPHLDRRGVRDIYDGGPTPIALKGSSLFGIFRSSVPELMSHPD